MVALRDMPFAFDAELLMEKYRVEPGTDQAAALADLVARIEQVAKPKALYEVAFIAEKGDDWVAVDGVRLTSRALRKNLDQVERLFPYVATCGAEVDSMAPAGGGMREKAWLYVLKGELVEIAVARVQEHIGRHYQIPRLSSMNPGSGDVAVWPHEQQKELFSLLGDVEGQIGARLTESCLLIPEMSVSGVMFPAEADFHSCQVCHRARCPGRRAPFSQEAWEQLCED